jgi:hypothetical protein
MARDYKAEYRRRIRIQEEHAARLGIKPQSHRAATGHGKRVVTGSGKVHASENKLYEAADLIYNARSRSHDKERGQKMMREWVNPGGKNKGITRQNIPKWVLELFDYNYGLIYGGSP